MMPPTNPPATARLFMMLLLACMLLGYSLQAQVNPFDTLKTLPAGDRYLVARAIYKKEFRKADSAAAFRGFEQLFAIARVLDDKPLECAVYDLHADYFSVNRGFNSLSLLYHQNAIDMAVKYNLPVDVAIHTFKKGLFFNTNKRFPEANRYLLEGYDLFKKAGWKNVPMASNYLHDLSTFHYSLGDLESAKSFVEEAFQYMDATSNELNMTNTLALVYRGLGREEDALRYFAKALELARKKNERVWVGIISGNIGLIHFNHERYGEAEKYLRTAYDETLNYGETTIAAESIIFLAKINLISGRLKEAADQLRLAGPLVAQVNKLDRWILLYETQAQLNEKMGRPTEALASWRHYDWAKDSLEELNNLAAVGRVKLRWEMDKYKLQVDQLKAEAETEIIKRNSIIAVLFLLMVITILIYRQQILQRKKERELFEKQEALLQSEKARAEDALSNASRELSNYTENLRAKNELIEKFKAEVELLHEQMPHLADQEKAAHIEKLMQAHIMTDETWDEFKKLFDKVYGGFLFRVRKKFVVATETDVRLIALIKLGLSTREMANMLGVTVDAVKKSRQRLKKKIQLPEEASLEEVVSLI